MSAPKMNWANVARKGAGQELVEFAGTMVSKERAAFLRKRYPNILLRARLEEQLAGKKRFRINDLPQEIRDIILEMALDYGIIPVFLNGRKGQPRPTQFPISKLAQAGDVSLRLQVLHLFLVNNVIEVHSFQGNQKLQTHLASIKFGGKNNLNNGFDAIKKLSFPYFSRFDGSLNKKPNADIEMMKKCKNLAAVDINFQWPTLMQNGDPKPVETLVRQFRLDGMLELKELEVIEIKGLWGWEYDDFSGVVKRLRDWFLEEFEKKKVAGERTKYVVLCLLGSSGW